jgi:hypothetical protein
MAVKRYAFQLVDIWFDGYFLYVLCSHEEVLKALESAVQSKITGSRLKSSDELYYMFENMKGKDRAMLSWCLGWLGDNQFEPYAASQHDKVSGYCFRRVLDRGDQPVR